MKKDRIFTKKMREIGDFNFNNKTAEVFDDMLERSIPFYHELQMMIGELAQEFAENNTSVYDLGCSTGTTILQLDKVLNKKVNFIGIDYSKPILDKCRKKLEQQGLRNKYELAHVDLNNPFIVSNASLVVVNLTLQFVRPSCRLGVLKEIYRGLNRGGCLILVEKVLSLNPHLEKVFVELYHDMKRRNGYSDLEIAQKAASLKNVLKIYSLKENLAFLAESGFTKSDIFFKWNNFCGIVAIK